MDAGITAQQVGQVVAYIAPGFFATLAYNFKFPRARADEFTLLVTAVVISLPLVSLADAIAHCAKISTSVTNISYVLLLLGVSIAAGYGLAQLRSVDAVRKLLGILGSPYQPESSIYAQTMLRLPPDAWVTIEFTDGRRLAGTPRSGPGLAHENIEELLITYPQWWDPQKAEWNAESAGKAVIVPINQIHSVTFDRDPIA
jgi:hypothetical protein